MSPKNRFMLLQTTSLRFAHPGQSPISFPDFSLAGGEALLLLGKSGSGKTTFLNLLAGLLTPNQGQVLLDGVVLSALQGHRLDLFRGQNIGIVFQKPLVVLWSVSLVSQLFIFIRLFGSNLLEGTLFADAK